MTSCRIEALAGALALTVHLAACGVSTPPARPGLADGFACGSDSSTCGSGHCSDGICCPAGNCCRVPSDCPAQYAAAATCTNRGEATDCQGTRTEATCVEFMCGSAVVQDDSACSGQVHDCGAYAPFGCSAAADQPVPACGDRCDDASQCAQGYTCAPSRCVAIAGAGQACTGTGQGTCADGLKCEGGVCCGNGAATCCNAQHACPNGLVCSAATATCGLRCTADTSIGCADQANTYCTDGMRCEAKMGLGEACGGMGGRCGTGHCVDGVCCDTDCTGEVCQRCDASSSAGIGHCGPVNTRSDPDRECGATTFACSGTCRSVTTAYACAGTRYACEGFSITADVPSGSVCVSDQIVPVSETSHCNVGGTCSGATVSRWYTSCDGAGACRAAGDTTHAAVQPPRSCGSFACNPSTFDCWASCTTDAECAPGVDGGHCLTSSVHAAALRNTCQSGALDAACDDPVGLGLPNGSDCDTSLGCTAQHICLLVVGSLCVSSAQCGEYLTPEGTVYDLTCQDTFRGGLRCQ